MLAEGKQSLFGLAFLPRIKSRIFKRETNPNLLIIHSHNHLILKWCMACIGVWFVWFPCIYFTFLITSPPPPFPCLHHKPPPKSEIGKKKHHLKVPFDWIHSMELGITYETPQSLKCSVLSSFEKSNLILL